MSSEKPIWKTKNDIFTTGQPTFPDLSDIGTSHAGWYYDLPLDGERVINDLQLRDGRLAVVCFQPGPDLCSDNSSSFLLELNAFSGGSIPDILFDLNQDGALDMTDTITSGHDADNNPIRVLPSGIKLLGNLQPPISLRLNNNVEVNYLSSSTGSVHLLKSPAVKTGIVYWKELEQ